MNWLNYDKLKVKGTVTLSKLGGAHVVTLKKFNPETGEEQLPIIEAVAITELQNVKAQLEEGLVSVNAAITDLQNLT
ncbi:MAG: hypothetical protein HY350_02290 [Candidatus Omnitrophica bacterium]|nr:hypothetical protein [Candidatus Omnitrophota bacterium]